MPARLGVRALDVMVTKLRHEVPRLVDEIAQDTAKLERASAADQAIEATVLRAIRHVIVPDMLVRVAP